MIFLRVALFRLLVIVHRTNDTTKGITIARAIVMKKFFIILFLIGAYGMCSTAMVEEERSLPLFGKVLERVGQGFLIRTTEFLIVNDLPDFGCDESVYNSVREFSLPFQIVYVTDIYPPGTEVRIAPYTYSRYRYERQGNRLKEVICPYIFPLRLDPSWGVWVPESFGGAGLKHFSVLQRQELKHYWFIGLGSLDWRCLSAILELVDVIKMNPSDWQEFYPEFLTQISLFLQHLQKASMREYEGIDYHFSVHASYPKTRSELIQMYPVNPTRETWCPYNWRAITAIVNTIRILSLYDSKEANDLKVLLMEYAKKHFPVAD